MPKFLTYKHRMILARNRNFKNKYKGKRCFIIGSGPSINDVDLGLLKDEYTFVCSEFDKHKQFQDLQPKFYILSDSAYFTHEQSEYSKYWQGQFIKKDKSINPNISTVFVNLGAKNFIESHNMFRNHRFYYFGTQGIFSDKLPFNIGIDKYVPFPKNSILLCLMIAVYMGFEEIFLMGCEHNFLNYNIGLGKVAAYTHSYADEISQADTANDQEMSKYIVPRERYLNYEGNIAHVYQLFKNYRFFYQKVKKLYPNTRIYNTTPNSYLDVFPVLNLKDVEF